MKVGRAIVNAMLGYLCRETDLMLMGRCGLVCRCDRFYKNRWLRVW